MTYDDVGLYIADDVRRAIESSGNIAHDYIVTVKIRPGQQPVYEARLAKKRRPRRRKDVSDKQVDMFATA